MFAQNLRGDPRRVKLAKLGRHDEGEVMPKHKNTQHALTYGDLYDLEQGYADALVGYFTQLPPFLALKCGEAQVSAGLRLSIAGMGTSRGTKRIHLFPAQEGLLRRLLSAVLRAESTWQAAKAPHHEWCPEQRIAKHQ